MHNHPNRKVVTFGSTINECDVLVTATVWRGEDMTRDHPGADPEATITSVIVEEGPQRGVELTVDHLSASTYEQLEEEAIVEFFKQEKDAALEYDEG